MNYYDNQELTHDQQSMEETPSSQSMVKNVLMSQKNPQPVLKVKAKDIKFSMKYKDKGSNDY
jgi:hypothetical protein